MEAQQHARGRTQKCAFRGPVQSFFAYPHSKRIQISNQLFPAARPTKNIPICGAHWWDPLRGLRAPTHREYTGRELHFRVCPHFDHYPVFERECPVDRALILKIPPRNLLTRVSVTRRLAGLHQGKVLLCCEASQVRRNGVSKRTSTSLSAENS